MADPSSAIAVDGITKVYRTGFWLNRPLTSLSGVSLQVDCGETFGLLGPNGAGKTTLLKTLLGIARPTQGSGTVLGRPLGDRATKQRIGYLPENPYFHNRLTGWEYLEYAAAAFKLPRAVAQNRIGELFDWVELSRRDARKKSMGQYSKGMLQRVGMAQALINDPELIFLDEPMSGLDPLGRYQMREIILSLKQQGKTLFFNSHILSDVERICDRVAILDAGRLLCCDRLDALLGEANTYNVAGQGGDRETLGSWVDALDYQNGFWRGQLSRKPEAFLKAIAGTGVQVTEMVLARPSLEQLFVERVRQAREG